MEDEGREKKALDELDQRVAFLCGWWYVERRDILGLNRALLCASHATVHNHNTVAVDTYVGAQLVVDLGDAMSTRTIRLITTLENNR